MEIENNLRHLLESLKKGEVDVDSVMERMSMLPYEDLGDVKLDWHRSIRRGIGEIIYTPGKSDDQLIKIARSIAEHRSNAIFSRVSKEKYELLKTVLPDLEYREEARLGLCRFDPPKERGNVAVIAAGSSDKPIAEEAAGVAEFAGCHVERFYDVGVAGIHRLFNLLPKIRKADAIVVAAGMEGALPSVVAGLVSSIVIAVPTSVGYGASFGGLAALLSMLNACSGGVVVVNIDNGVGAGLAAALVATK